METCDMPMWFPILFCLVIGSMSMASLAVILWSLYSLVKYFVT